MLLQANATHIELEEGLVVDVEQLIIDGASQLYVYGLRGGRLLKVSQVVGPVCVCVCHERACVRSRSRVVVWLCGGVCVR